MKGIKLFLSVAMIVATMGFNHTIYGAINCKASDGTTAPVQPLPDSKYKSLPQETRNVPYKKEVQSKDNIILGVNVQAYQFQIARPEFGCKDNAKVWKLLSIIEIETIEHWALRSFPIYSESFGDSGTFMCTRQTSGFDATALHEEQHATLATEFVAAQASLFKLDYKEVYLSREEADTQAIYLNNLFNEAYNEYFIKQKDHPDKEFENMRPKIISFTDFDHYAKPYPTCKTIEKIL